MKSQSPDEETILALKLQNLEQQRQMEMLLRRINLLMKQQKGHHSLPHESKKLKYAYEKKRLHDQLKDELRRAKQKAEGPKPERKSDFKMEQAVKFAMEEVLQKKKQEAEEIKKLNQINDMKIIKQKDEFLSERRKHKMSVQQQEYQSKVKYQKYWEDRTQKYLQEQQRAKDSLSNSLNQKESLQKALERQELQLVQQIQESRSQEQFLNKQIEDAKTMKVEEYERKYGKPKENKYQTIMNIKANSK